MTKNDPVAESLKLKIRALESEKARLQEEVDQKDSLIQILQLKDSFESFLDEVKRCLSNCRKAISHHNLPALRVALHTLKANTSAFGLHSILTEIDRLEGLALVDRHQIDHLEELFRVFLETHRKTLQIDWSAKPEDHYLITQHDLDHFQARLHATQKELGLKKAVLAWLDWVRLKKAIDLLGPMVAFTESLADRKGKKVRADVVNGYMLINSAMAKPVFKVLPHLLRNAVDHGIETALERGAKGAVGHIKIEFKSEPGFWLVEVKDDGRGIDLQEVCDAVLEKRLMGDARLAELTAKEKLRLIFLDGLSTAKRVSDISGRGLGLSAVLHSIQELGGSVDVRSTVGRGTQFSLRIPVRPTAPSGVAVEGLLGDE